MASSPRDAIDSAGLVELLQEFVRGRRDLSTPQIKACEVLLRKTLPDLAAQQVQVLEDSRIIVEIVQPAPLPLENVPQTALIPEVPHGSR